MAKQNIENDVTAFSFDDEAAFSFNEEDTLALDDIGKPSQQTGGNPLPDFIEDDGGSRTKIDGKVDTPTADEVPIGKKKPTEVQQDSKEKTKDSLKPKKQAKTDEEDEEEDDGIDYSFDSLEGQELEKDKNAEESKVKGKEKQKAEDTTPKPTKVELDEDYYTNLALDNIERGILSTIELPKDRKLTEDEYFDLQEQEFNNRLTQAFTEFGEELDQDGKDFLRHKRAKGSTQEFLTKYLTQGVDLSSFDPEDKNKVNQVIDYYLKNVEELDGEELDERKEFIKNGGKQKALAETFYNKLKKAEDKRKEAMLQAAEDKAKSDADKRANFLVSLEETAKDTNKVGIFSVGDKEKPSLVNAITKPTVRTEKGMIPSFAAKLGKILGGRTAEDRKNLLVLAKIIENNFNIEDLVNTVQTDITKKTKARISNRQPQTTTARVGAKELADVVD